MFINFHLLFNDIVLIIYHNLKHLIISSKLIINFKVGVIYVNLQVFIKIIINSKIHSFLNLFFIFK